MRSGRKGPRSRDARSGRAGDLSHELLVVVDGLDDEGHPVARPLDWAGDGKAPVIVLDPSAGSRRGPAAAPGDRAVVRIHRHRDGRYHGRVRRIITPETRLITGVYQTRGNDGIVVDTSRSRVREYRAVDRSDLDMNHGDLVVAEPIDTRRFGPPHARIVRKFGHWSNADAISFSAIMAHDIPVEFPPAVLAEADAAGETTDFGAREDLSAIPFVTIDDDDARDHDDAVFAEPCNEHGATWHAVVAIADVAHFVRPGSSLDQEALERGNSVYFPDRVVPMLPEQLSNGLCSLKPGEIRPCVAVHLRIAADGSLRHWQFVRGIMRSRARLTYDEVESHRSGHPSQPTRRLPRELIGNLYGVYDALVAARRRRGALDIERPEQKVSLDGDGRVVKIGLRNRLDSHRLIEELMIAANVAAARELASKGIPALFRIHDHPTLEKTKNLRAFLKTLGITLGEGSRPKSGDLAQVLERAAGSDIMEPVQEIVLRCQALAEYSPVNIGHFGLALKAYCHFTSPIRRYADLMVHRAIIQEATPERTDLSRIGDHLGAKERRATSAERSAMDHYVVAWLAEHLDVVMTGHITGLGRFGVFVRIDETAADGLVPSRYLPGGPFRFHEGRQELEGKGVRYRLGERVSVRLVEADAIAATLTLHLVEGGEEIPARSRNPRRRKTR